MIVRRWTVMVLAAGCGGPIDATELEDLGYGDPSVSMTLPQYGFDDLDRPYIMRTDRTLNTETLYRVASASSWTEIPTPPRAALEYPVTLDHLFLREPGGTDPVQHYVVVGDGVEPVGDPAPCTVVAELPDGTIICDGFEPQRLYRLAPGAATWELYATAVASEGMGDAHALVALPDGTIVTAVGGHAGGGVWRTTPDGVTTKITDCTAPALDGCSFGLYDGGLGQGRRALFTSYADAGGDAQVATIFEVDVDSGAIAAITRFGDATRDGRIAVASFGADRRWLGVRESISSPRELVEGDYGADDGDVLVENTPDLGSHRVVVRGGFVYFLYTLDEGGIRRLRL